MRIFLSNRDRSMKDSMLSVYLKRSILCYWFVQLISLQLPLNIDLIFSKEFVDELHYLKSLHYESVHYILKEGWILWSPWVILCWASILVFFRQKHAKYLFFLMTLFFFVRLFLFGMNIQSPLEQFFSNILLLFWGAILVLLFLVEDDYWR